MEKEEIEKGTPYVIVHCWFSWHILFIVAVILAWDLICPEHKDWPSHKVYLVIFGGVTFFERILVEAWHLPLHLPLGVGQLQPLASRILKLTVCPFGGKIGRWFNLIQCNAIWYNTIQYNIVHYSTTQHNMVCWYAILLALPRKCHSLLLSNVNV